MALALQSCYAGWACCFLRGRIHRLLLEPFRRVPRPLAFSPIADILVASALLASWPPAAAALVLVAGHLAISRRSFRALSRRAPAR